MKSLPEHIGPYKIIEKLGEGGFSTVYLAYTNHLDESDRVALKVLNSRENYGRFRREVETVAKLHHPNIIRIYDTGEDEQTKTPFFSMEYIPTGTLFDRLEAEQCLPREEAVDIIKQVGIALAYPHKQGIIHRDVNPKNILLDTRQKPARPVLTDFGLVKPLGPGDSKLTETVALIGTFAYYAPEQWNKDNLGPATDVYALAITFFEMLAGRRPFNGDVFSLREKHLYEPLPPLSEVAPELGPYFDEVLIKATAKNPSARYQDVDSFIKDIETANQQARQAEKDARQKKAVEAIEVTRELVHTGEYEITEVLPTIEAALKDYPEYVEGLHLSGKVKFEQGQIAEALTDYQQAYGQVRNPASEVGQDYLKALKQAIPQLWQQEAYAEAIQCGKTIKQVLDEDAKNGTPAQAWQDAWSDLVRLHYEAGIATYAGGQPEDLAQAMNALQQRIEALQALGAQQQSQQLQSKLGLLRAKNHYNTAVSAYRAGNTDLLADAITILEQQLQTLNPAEAPTEHEELQNKLTDLQVKTHYGAAIAAYAGGEPEDIHQAIALLEREVESLKALQAGPEAEEVADRLETLRAKGRKDKHYQEVLALVDNRQYSEALDRLDETFIQTGSYEYKNVAELLWKLVHAKQHNGELPARQAAPEELPKLKQQYEINRYLIPLALAVAIITGGLVAPQLQSLPGTSVLTVVAWGLFIAYFGYYIWVYYINR